MLLLCRHQWLAGPQSAVCKDLCRDLGARTFMVISFWITTPSWPAVGSRWEGRGRGGSTCRFC